MDNEVDCPICKKGLPDKFLWEIQVIEEDELYEAMVELTEIKNHLKQHFDLWGDNQPWHLFDRLHMNLALMAQRIGGGEPDET